MNEILDMLASHARMEQIKRKNKILDDFIIAEVTALNLAALMDSEHVRRPWPWDYYPSSFKEEKREYEEAETQRELEAYKEARKEYIQEYNKRRHG